MEGEDEEGMRKVTIDGGDDLVGDNDGNAKLVGQAHQGTQEAGKVHLTVGELATTRVVRAERMRR